MKAFKRCLKKDVVEENPITLLKEEEEKTSMNVSMVRKE
jgi:hypothetical protein